MKVLFNKKEKEMWGGWCNSKGIVCNTKFNCLIVRPSFLRRFAWNKRLSVL